MIHRLRLLDLLGRHVLRRPEHPLRLRQCYVRFASKNFRDAEIGDFYAPFLIQQNILRLDVAMHDAFVVRELQRLAYLRHDLQCLAR